jgi:hypothetical protein
MRKTNDLVSSQPSNCGVFGPELTNRHPGSGTPQVQSACFTIFRPTKIKQSCWLRLFKQASGLLTISARPVSPYEICAGCCNIYCCNCGWLSLSATTDSRMVGQLSRYGINSSDCMALFTAARKTPISLCTNMSSMILGAMLLM